jgi:hypothetical protein
MHVQEARRPPIEFPDRAQSDNSKKRGMEIQQSRLRPYRRTPRQPSEHKQWTGFARSL